MVKIPTPTLESLIGKTKFAISMEESRYTLNGGLLILKPIPSRWSPQTATAWLLPKPIKARGLEWRSKSSRPQEAMDEVENSRALQAPTRRWNSQRRKPSLLPGRPPLADLRILTGQFPNYEAVLPAKQ